MGTAVNLRQLRAAHPDRFYGQSWYTDEPFMLVGSGGAIPTPIRLEHKGREPALHMIPLLPRAIDLALAFLADPEAPIWGSFLWCADLDRRRQRIYVGNVGAHNGHRFEIHRHLKLTERWGVPAW